MVARFKPTSRKTHPPNMDDFSRHQYLLCSFSGKNPGQLPNMDEFSRYRSLFRPISGKIIQAYNQIRMSFPANDICFPRFLESLSKLITKYGWVFQDFPKRVNIFRNFRKFLIPSAEEFIEMNFGEFGWPQMSLRWPQVCELDCGWVVHVAKYFNNSWIYFHNFHNRWHAFVSKLFK